MEALNKYETLYYLLEKYVVSEEDGELKDRSIEDGEVELYLKTMLQLQDDLATRSPFLSALHQFRTETNYYKEYERRYLRPWFDLRHAVTFVNCRKVLWPYWDCLKLTYPFLVDYYRNEMESGSRFGWWNSPHPVELRDYDSKIPPEFFEDRGLDELIGLDLRAQEDELSKRFLRQFLEDLRKYLYEEEIEDFAIAFFTARGWLYSLFEALERGWNKHLENKFFSKLTADQIGKDARAYHHNRKRILSVYRDVKNPAKAMAQYRKWVDFYNRITAGDTFGGVRSLLTGLPKTKAGFKNLIYALKAWEGSKGQLNNEVLPYVLSRLDREWEDTERYSSWATLPEHLRPLVRHWEVKSKDLLKKVFKGTYEFNPKELDLTFTTYWDYTDVPLISDWTSEFAIEYGNEPAYPEVEKIGLRVPSLRSTTEGDLIGFFEHVKEWAKTHAPNTRSFELLRSVGSFGATYVQFVEVFGDDYEVSGFNGCEEYLEEE